MKTVSKILSVILFLACFGLENDCFAAYADENVRIVGGNVYDLGDNSNYEYSSADPSHPASEVDTYGEFKISGNISENGKNSDITAYGADGGEVEFTYEYSDKLLNASSDQWHLVEDGGKKVDDIELDSKIGYGTIILQYSKDKNIWMTAKVITNAFSDTPNRTDPFYTARDIQLVNGTFFRVTVVYKTAIKTGESSIGPFKSDEFNYKKTAEVYEFYLYDVNSEKKISDMTPTKNLGSVVNTGNDNGYSGDGALTIDDPHYGWTLGQFFIGGYTRDMTDPVTKTPIFLKNVGDEVTLWFNLKQNIDRLNGDSTLSINGDSNGYDQYFQMEKTDMGRGTLIIRYTDHQGITHEPQIYTNYLEANAVTSANTIVKFFEEGDYEVALDYEIKSAPVNLAGIELFPTYTNYRIFFSFAIRNGNCMVYPFDVESGTELADQSIAPNGFELNMAKSRYLTIDVRRAVVSEGANGYVEDVRFNRPAKDGDRYIDDGIYTFNVKNLYTGENTQKTIYVGDTGYMKALSVNKMTVAELNAQLSQGAVIENNGSLVIPEPVTETEPSTETETEPPTETEISSETVAETTAPSVQVLAETAETKTAGEHPTTSAPILIIIGVAVSAVVIGGVIALKNKKEK